MSVAAIHTGIDACSHCVPLGWQHDTILQPHQGQQAHVPGVQPCTGAELMKPSAARSLAAWCSTISGSRHIAENHLMPISVNAHTCELHFQVYPVMTWHDPEKKLMDIHIIIKAIATAANRWPLPGLGTRGPTCSLRSSCARARTILAASTIPKATPRQSSPVLQERHCNLLRVHCLRMHTGSKN